MKTAREHKVLNISRNLAELMCHGCEQAPCAHLKWLHPQTDTTEDGEVNYAYMCADSAGKILNKCVTLDLSVLINTACTMRKERWSFAIKGHVYLQTLRDFSICRSHTARLALFSNSFLTFTLSHWKEVNISSFFIYKLSICWELIMYICNFSFSKIPDTGSLNICGVFLAFQDEVHHPLSCVVAGGPHGWTRGGFYLPHHQRTRSR